MIGGPMTLKSVKVGQIVRLRSVSTTSEEYPRSKNELLKYIGRVFKVEVKSDNLQKCMFVGVGNWVFHYSDLSLDEKVIKPEGGKFDVQNLVR